MWPGGVASPTLSRRIHHAAVAARDHPGALIVATGGSGHWPPAEADVIARDLRALGVDPDRILRERRSRSTFENLRFARLLLRSRAIREVILVTDSYHMPRAMLTARRLGLRPAGAPVPWSPDMSRRRRLRAALREVLAFGAYAVRFRFSARWRNR